MRDAYKLTKLLMHWFKSEYGVKMRFTPWFMSDSISKDDGETNCPNFCSISVRKNNRPSVVLRNRNREISILMIDPESPDFLDKIIKYFKLNESL